jgi:hypothetical protein
MPETQDQRIKRLLEKPKFKKTAQASDSRAQEYNIVSEFQLGYRNREDITNLPKGVLIVGSQNVLTNVSDRIAVRQGFTLDGQSSTNTGGFPSSYDWNRHTGDERNLRAGQLTTSSNGVLQVRYVATVGDYYNGTTFTQDQVYWITIKSSMTSVSLNFAEFWDFTTEKKGFLLWVDGTSNIYEWSGAITTMASAGAATITKNGTTTWAQIGAYTAGTRKVTINGTDYTYTGGEGTTTLTGVTPTPAAEPANSVIFQTVRVTANSAMTAIPSTFANSLISNLRNQIYIGSLVDNTVYISKLNNYIDYSFATPRVVGEGAYVTLDAPPVGFVPQEEKMYVTAGKDYWYETKFTLSSDLAKESFEIIRLKTGSRQAAQSQAMIRKMKNQVIFVSNEPTLDELGRVEQILGTPQSMNISDSIKLDFDDYDFTGASVFYFKYFIYVAIPVHNIVRMYNIVKGYWEAPQILPVGRFAVIGGELYGHGFGISETYKMFNGYNDNGKSMEAIALFSFMNYGTRTALKSFNKFYSEGYIDSNTTLTLSVQYDVDGCATNTSYDIIGSNGQLVCLGGASDDSSLGKISLGKRSLGGSSTFSSSSSLPPKFRWIQTFPQTDFFEYQPSFSSIGIDQRWELLGFGGSGGVTVNIPVSITT